MVRTKYKTHGLDGARPSRKGDSMARSAERAREAKRELARRADGEAAGGDGNLRIAEPP